MNRDSPSGFDHRQAWDLIPWLVNGRASPQQYSLVLGHLESCTDCREEYARQRHLQAALAQDEGADPDPQPALRRLWARIDEEDESGLHEHRSKTAREAVNGRATRWLTRGLLAAVIVEAIGLGAQSAVLWRRTDVNAPLYRTLSIPAPLAPAATIRAVLTPAATLGEMQTWLQEAGLQIVAGPSAAGVYSLAPAGASEPETAESLASLRAHPQVRLAEPIVAASQLR